MKRVISIDERSRTRLRKRALSGRAIFNPDKRRRQASLRRTDGLVRRAWAILLERSLVTVDHRIGSAVVLQSLPGCQRQAWHTDYDPVEIVDIPKPKGVILALEDGTFFATPGRTYSLDQGDVLCFDGDEVHAGAAYDTTNTRVHLYADVPSVKRPPNKTWLVTREDDDVHS